MVGASQPLDYTSIHSPEASAGRHPGPSLQVLNRQQASNQPSIMTSTHREDIQRRIIELEVEHRDLDSVIDMLTRDTRSEDLQLRRLKKRKLQLKDHISLLKMQLVPDIPA